jgi:hypothetical protein
LAVGGGKKSVVSSNIYVTGCESQNGGGIANSDDWQNLNGQRQNAK